MGRNYDIFPVGSVSRKKEPIFPSWLDAMNYAILDALPPPYRHGKEVCQGCFVFALRPGGDSLPLSLQMA